MSICRETITLDGLTWYFIFNLWLLPNFVSRGGFWMGWLDSVLLEINRGSLVFCWFWGEMELLTDSLIRLIYIWNWLFGVNRPNYFSCDFSGVSLPLCFIVLYVLYSKYCVCVVSNFCIKITKYLLVVLFSNVNLVWDTFIQFFKFTIWCYFSLMSILYDSHSDLCFLIGSLK